MLSDAWALAIETLCLIEQKRLSEKLALATELKRLRVENPNVIGLANKLVCETVRRQNFIDHMSSGILKSASMDELHPKVRAFLRLFVYSAKIEGRDNYRKAVAAAKIGRSILGWQRLERVEEFLGSCLGLDPERTLEGLGDIEKVSLQVFLPRWFVKYCFRLLGR